jgi:hypothetical protein
MGKRQMGPREVIMSRTKWLPLPGYNEYEVSQRGELRGAKKKRRLNKKQQTSIWRKIICEGGTHDRAANPSSTPGRTERDRALRLVQRHAAALPVDHRGRFLEDLAARLAPGPSDEAVEQALNVVLRRTPRWR